MKASLPTFISAQVQKGRYWFLNLNPAGGENTTAVCGGYEFVTPQYRVERSEFTFPTVEVVTGGRGSLDIAGRTFALAAGVAFSYGPGVPHCIRTDSQRPLKKHFLSFAGGPASMLLDSGPLGKRRPAVVTDMSLVVDFLSLIQANAVSECGAAGSICGHLIEALMIKLAEVRKGDGPRRTCAAETYRRAREYFRTEYRSIATVGQAAAHLRVSAEYLTRLFHRFGDTTPHDYLNGLKMSHAASALMRVGTRVKDVADELGFSDPFHFSRAFKTHYGMPPSQFAGHLAPGGRVRATGPSPAAVPPLGRMP